MKHLLFGAALGLVWLLSGLPLVPVATVLAAAVQPVTVAFAAGLATCPMLMRMQRWTR